MTTVRRKSPKFGGGTLVFLPIAEIAPNPVQPRKTFPDEDLRELANSIREHGVLQPLCVRLRGGRYELIAGERRLRAASLVGLSEVPCLLMQVNMEQSSVLALVENLQRRDLSFVEEAEGIRQLIRLFGLSQEEIARRLGRSQSAVANKLRLLKLGDTLLQELCAQNLTERHARALLRLPAERRNDALREMAAQRMNVAQAEAFVEQLLSPPVEKIESGRVQKQLFVMKDVRLFFNTVNRSLALMRSGGIAADMEKSETAQEYILTVHIPKGKAEETEALLPTSEP